MENSVKLAIVIANYNTKDEIYCCLKSIYQNHPSQSFDIYVVDNASSDGSCKMIKEKFPLVHLIENKENEGFVRANNRGILESSSQYILHLRPDTLLLKGTADKMMDFMEEHAEIGVLGCKLVTSDGKYQPSCDKFPSAKGELIHSLYIDKILKSNRLFGEYTLSNWKHNKVMEVDWVTGTCLMVRRKAVEDVGLKDSNNFLNYEDIDWCYRMKKNGWKIYFIPDAKVVHDNGKSTRAMTQEVLLISYLSRYYFFKKHFGMPACYKIRRICRYGLLLRIIGCSLVFPFIGSNRKSYLARFRGYCDALKIELEKKIAIDVTSFSPQKAGVENYTYNLTQNILKTDSKSSYQLMDLGLKSEQRNLKNSVFHKAFRAVNHIFRMQVVFPLKLLANRSMLLHSPAFISPVLKLCKTVITIHDLSFLLYPKMFLFPYWLYLRIFVPLSARLADMVIVDSNNTKKDVIELLHLPQKKVRVIYAGVDERYRVVEDKNLIEDFRIRHNLPKEFILFVGNIEPRKNLMGLIKSFYEFRKRKTCRHRLVLAGKMGWLYEDILKLIKNMNLEDEVIFTGYIPDEDMPLLYNSASLFVYPSFYEGFGLPPLEAMACGVPVIVSNVSSLPEVVGYGGFLVAPDDYIAIADAMEKFLSDMGFRREYIARGLERAKIFTWHKTALEIVKVYNECLNEKIFLEN